MRLILSAAAVCLALAVATPAFARGDESGMVLSVHRGETATLSLPGNFNRGEAMPEPHHPVPAAPSSAPAWGKKGPSATMCKGPHCGCEGVAKKKPGKKKAAAPLLSKPAH